MWLASGNGRWLEVTCVPSGWRLSSEPDLLLGHYWAPILGRALCWKGPGSTVCLALQELTAQWGGQVWKPLSHRVIKLGQCCVPGKMDQQREWSFLVGWGGEIREGFTRKHRPGSWRMHKVLEVGKVHKGIPAKVLVSPLSSLVAYILLRPSWYHSCVCLVSRSPRAAGLNIFVPVSSSVKIIIVLPY